MSNYTIDLIEKTFDDSFELSRYRQFVGELFSGYVQKPFIHNKTYIADGFEESVALFGRIGTYTDPEDQTIDILYVKLETHLHNRSLQRNFIARHLKKRDKDAALVAFYTDSSPDWRLSLVWRTQEMLFDEEKEKVKFKERLTPTRRSSYLLGKNEPSHTAKRQLLPLLKQLHPTLATLQEAFSVETVTKQFFDQYKTLFLRLHEEIGRLLAHEPKIAADFKSHAIDSANFAKKLLGQIVFLYFLQKKGWLGVTREGAWGSGPTDFLRRLFAKETISYTNFFDEVLEPLFYEALAEQRANDWYATLHCKIPFLNGGLFEPMNGYAWRALALNLPNAIFSNDEKSADGDNGTGILDVFDRYNFTVREEEPLEKEVAVDPEMLGKVFENLLEVTDRKSKGAFYTPREIVHYMCQESLINYLATALPDLPHADLAMLIREGELLIENDKAKNDGRKSGTYQLPQTVRDHAQALDEALARVTVCDPAIGSGAFPVGMLTEIVKARTVLQQLGQLPAQTTYDLKRHAIQQSLYGVDIDAAAVDVAKLRLWLSLVVDEDDYRTIKPLPNLSYRIACGNSLLSVQRDLLNDHLFAELEKLKQLHFEEINSTQKQKLQTQIESVIAQLTNGSKQFDFNIYFSEVMQTKGGFDIVIGNPPYVVSKDAKLREIYKESVYGRPNLYGFFIHKSLELLSQYGVLVFINPRTLLTDAYFSALRRYILKNASILLVLNIVNRRNVFDSVLQSTIVNIFSRNPKIKTVRIKNVSTKAEINQSNEIEISRPDFLYSAQNDSIFIVSDNELSYSIFRKLASLPTFSQAGLNFTTGKIQWDLYKKLLSSTPEKNAARLIWAENIQRFYFAPPRLRGDKIYINGPMKNCSPIKQKTIVVQRTTAVEQPFRIIATIVDPSGFGMPIQSENNTSYLVSNSHVIHLNYVLALLNSKFLDFVFRHINSNTHVSSGELNALPFPTEQPEKLPILIQLVGQVLATKQANLTADVTALEREIDQIVYQLYGLTSAEIALIEAQVGNTPNSSAELPDDEMADDADQ